MTSEHLNDPLDYLYEELPPEKMAEVRTHLAACPECREEVRVIRETVKTYRQAERPVAPAGLAARAAARALEEARLDADDSPPSIGDEAVEPAEATDATARSVEIEFDRLKKEILADAPRGWRIRLFHPFWTVAASVIFVCAILIHVSPRGNRWVGDGESMPDAPVVHERPVSTQPSKIETLPEPKAMSDHVSSEYQPVPPILRQAEKLGERLDMGASQQAASTPEATASALRAKEAAKVDLPIAAPKIIDDLAAPARGRASSNPAEKAEELFQKLQERVSDGRSGLRPPPAPLSAPPPAAAPAQPADRNFESDARDDYYGLKPSTGSVPVPSSAALPAEPSLAPPAEIPDKSPANHYMPGYSEAHSSGYAPLAPITLPGESAATASEPILLDMFEGSEPPQLIERPTPVDVDKSILNLTTLVGMHISLGEFGEARIAIGLLSKFDAAKAEELMKMLKQAEHAAINAGVVPGMSVDASESPQPGDVPPPDAAPVTDKYYTPSIESPPTGLLEEPPFPGDGSAVLGQAAPDSTQAADAIPASAFDYAHSGPAYADAPTVPKASPDAIPPTLWESGRAARSERRNYPAASRPFSTDPYYRDR